MGQGGGVCQPVFISLEVSKHHYISSVGSARTARGALSTESPAPPSPAPPAELFREEPVMGPGTRVGGGFLGSCGHSGQGGGACVSDRKLCAVEGDSTIKEVF